MDRLVPAANSAITSAPCPALALRAATSRAEYSKPQGSRDHTVPIINGAASRCPPTQPRARCQMALPVLSIHTGWRALNNSSRPTATAATWNRVQTGRMAADCVVNQPTPCIDAAATPPSKA